jgi:hypothetical protein
VALDKTNQSIRNGIAWFRNAANQARLDGDDATADRLMTLLRIVYVGFSNEMLAKLPLLKAGDMVTCPQCGKEHELFDSGLRRRAEGTAEEGTAAALNPLMVLSYRCDDRSYLAL